MWILLTVLLGCWGENAYIIEGTVVEVRPDVVVIDHKDIPGLMPAMIMPFKVADPSLLDGLAPGDRIYGRYEIGEGGGALQKLRVTGHGPAPAAAAHGPGPLQPGDTLPPVELMGHRGESLILGHGGGRPTLLTFIYTRCPLPEACPAMMMHLAVVEQALPAESEARVVAVTLDPAFDSVEVLARYAVQEGLSDRWTLARVEPDVLKKLAGHGGLVMLEDRGQIVHGLRMLVLDGNGQMLARFDDTAFDVDEVVKLLSAN